MDEAQAGNMGVAIDDQSRIGFTTIQPNDTRTQRLPYSIFHAVRYHAWQGNRFKPVTTDNGAGN